MGEKQTIFNQDFEVLAEVISGALGGSSKNEKVFAPKTSAEAVAQFNAVVGNK